MTPATPRSGKEVKRMPQHRRVFIIAKERPFDAEKWKQLLSAFAYILHEQRQEREAAAVETPPTNKDQS